MFRVTRAIFLLPLLLALGGCGTSSFWDSANSVQDRVQDALSDFNPFGTAKKPLPGERRAVFPEGVPGVQQGVPSDLVRGNQQAVETPAQAAAPAPAPEPKAAKTKGTKSKVAKKTPRQQQPAEEQEPAAGAAQPDEVWPPPPQNGTGLRR